MWYISSMKPVRTLTPILYLLLCLLLAGCTQAENSWAPNSWAQTAASQPTAPAATRPVSTGTLTLTDTPMPMKTPTTHATETSRAVPSSGTDGMVSPSTFYYGVDASYLKEIENGGGKYYQNGEASNALQIYKDHGVNAIRLRLWVQPNIPHNDLQETLVMARRVKALGLALMIDFHYSDSWADPGKQTKPAAWADLSGAELEKAVREYTRDVIRALKEQDTLPDMVQIGNEITPGMLWDDGRVGLRIEPCCTDRSSGVGEGFEDNWPELAALLKAGAAGVQEGAGEPGKVQIILHVDAGGDNEKCRWFFDHIVEQQAPFDIIGLSYYPWWHGSLADLENNLNDLAERYQKPVMVVETAYPWTLKNNDTVKNLVDVNSKLLPEFPPTVEGQKAFLQAEIEILKRVPGGLGQGMFYWGADDITSPGRGSVFENATVFDFKGHVLDSLNVYLVP